MFKGKFGITKNENGQWEGALVMKTPAGPFVMRYNSPDDSKNGGLAVMGELMDGASYFPVQALIGRGPATYAKRLHKSMKSKDKAKRAKAYADYQEIAKRAKSGNARAQDMAYGVHRLAGEDAFQAHYQQRQGFIPNDASAILLRPAVLAGHALDKASRDQDHKAGAEVFKAYNNPKTRKRAKRAHLYLKHQSLVGNTRAKKALSTIRDLTRAEKERRRQGAVSSVQGAGGFNFDNFLKDVGKVAGPVMKALAPVAKFVPFVGPLLEPAMNLASDAISKQPEAMRKVDRINKLADAGVPKAIRARTALKVAQKIKRAKAVTDAIKTGALRPDKQKTSKTKGDMLHAYLARRSVVTDYQRGLRDGAEYARRSMR